MSIKNLPFDIAYTYISNIDFCSLVEALQYGEYIERTKGDNRYLRIMKCIEEREDFVENFPPIPPLQNETAFSLDSFIQEAETSERGVQLLQNPELSWEDILKVCKELDNTDVWDLAITLPKFKQKFPLKGESTITF